jgi:hypothetical protein
VVEEEDHRQGKVEAEVSLPCEAAVAGHHREAAALCKVEAVVGHRARCEVAVASRAPHEAVVGEVRHPSEARVGLKKV